MLIKKIWLLNVGHCTHPERIAISEGGWFKPAIFPALCLLMYHERLGYILFDTGYSKRFFQATKRWPYLLYRYLLPVHLKKEEELIQQLKTLNVDAHDIKYIIISHFHADHISGIANFPQAKYICSANEFNYLKNLAGFRAIINGFLFDLIPNTFEKQALFVENFPKISPPSSLYPFTEGYDLFADKSIIAIPLAGHSIGQFGLYLEAEQKEYFFIADACWSKKCFIEKKLPLKKIVSKIIADWPQYEQTIQKLNILHQANPKITIIPSHCQTSWKEWGNA